LSYNSVRLEVLNEKRSASVQMLKLAEKERDSLEVLILVLQFDDSWHLSVNV
jgi:hypothetical protein